MADISKCNSQICPKRYTCVRFLAKRDKYQSYFIIPEEEQKVGCGEYWEYKGDHIYGIDSDR